LRDLGRHIAWGIGGFFVELPITMIMAAVGLLIFSALPQPSHPATEEILKAKNLASVVPILFFGSVTAPIWEEFVFRGLIFPALFRVIGRVATAAVITGFIFAMIHPQGIVLWMALATVGTVGCALTYQTRSLIPTVVMHMLHNSTIFIAVLLAMGYQKV
jgi:membrane protease YdiL (CAAX protease family)